MTIYTTCVVQVVKLKTPLRLINPFYGGYVKEWFKYYDDDDDDN